MSWRLEDRDLSGTWRLSERELEALFDVYDGADQGLDLQTVIVARGAEWRSKWEAYQTFENKTYLGERLDVVRRLIPPGSALVDLGTDHAHLPITAVRSGVSPCAIGIDIARAPLHAAQRTVENACLEGYVGLLLGDGLKPLCDGQKIDWTYPLSDEGSLRWDECKRTQRVTVTVCGVGGNLAAELISSIPPWVSAFIIQANDQPELVDAALSQRAREDSFSDVTTRVTVDRRRLFLTKCMIKGSASESERDKFMIWLWRWLELSRWARRVACTPPKHPSIINKKERLASALFRFLLQQDS